MTDREQQQRLYAQGLIECGGCGALIPLLIPVETWMEHDGEQSVIKAKVDDEVDWQQPVWDHALTEHGPADPAEGRPG